MPDQHQSVILHDPSMYRHSDRSTLQWDMNPWLTALGFTEVDWRGAYVIAQLPKNWASTFQNRDTVIQDPDGNIRLFDKYDPEINRSYVRVFNPHELELLEYASYMHVGTYHEPTLDAAGICERLSFQALPENELRAMQVKLNIILMGTVLPNNGLLPELSGTVYIPKGYVAPSLPSTVTIVEMTIDELFTMGRKTGWITDWWLVEEE